jgi:hypothetical protein
LEILAIIVAFWLLLVGIYGGISLTSSGRRHRRAAHRNAGLRSAAVSARTGAAADQPVLGGLFSEVDMLRAQVEHLRSEVTALSGAPVRPEKARIKRYRTGAYTDLPRMLRRHVREARSLRHPLGV